MRARAGDYQAPELPEWLATPIGALPEPMASTVRGFAAMAWEAGITEGMAEMRRRRKGARGQAAAGQPDAQPVAAEVATDG